MQRELKGRSEPQKYILVQNTFLTRHECALQRCEFKNGSVTHDCVCTHGVCECGGKSRGCACTVGDQCARSRIESCDALFFSSSPKKLTDTNSTNAGISGSSNANADPSSGLPPTDARHSQPPDSLSSDPLRSHAGDTHTNQSPLYSNDYTRNLTQAFTRSFEYSRDDYEDFQLDDRELVGGGFSLSEVDGGEIERGNCFGDGEEFYSAGTTNKPCPPTGELSPVTTSTSASADTSPSSMSSPLSPLPTNRQGSSSLIGSPQHLSQTRAPPHPVGRPTERNGSVNHGSSVGHGGHGGHGSYGAHGNSVGYGGGSDSGQASKAGVHGKNRNRHESAEDQRSDRGDERTTVMLRNIPNKYTQLMVLEVLDADFEGLYDFFYLPIDFKNKCNVGYAFINFIHSHYARLFFEKFSGVRLTAFKSKKVCEVSWGRLQGLQANFDHYRNSAIMSVAQAQYKPWVAMNALPLATRHGH